MLGARSMSLKNENEQLPYCPARCKRTKKCHGRAYFLAKPGPAVNCPWCCKARRDWEERQKDRKARGLEYMKF